MGQQNNLQTFTMEEVKEMTVFDKNAISFAYVPPILEHVLGGDTEIKISIDLHYDADKLNKLIAKETLEQIFGKEKAEEIRQGRRKGMIYITMDSGAETEEWDRKICDRVIRGLQHLTGEGFTVERFDKVVEGRTQKRIITISRAK